MDKKAFKHRKQWHAYLVATNQQIKPLMHETLSKRKPTERKKKRWHTIFRLDQQMRRRQKWIQGKGK